jgi:hypothetical protein
MDELQKLIKKWDEQIALHRRVYEDPIMYTKENRLKNSHYAQAICAVVADLKKLTIPAVVGQSEQFYCHQQSPMKHNRCIQQCDNCANKQ